MPDRPWLRDDPASNALTLSLHVVPNAARTTIDGLHGDRLKVRLAARPVDGEANAALRAFLAEAFGVPPTRVELLSGHSGRAKRVRILSPARRPDRDWAQPR